MERSCLELGRQTDEGAQVLRYVGELLEPPPAGIGLPDEWVPPFMTATAHLERLLDQLTDHSPEWLGFTKEIAERIRRA